MGRQLRYFPVPQAWASCSRWVRLGTEAWQGWAVSILHPVGFPMASLCILGQGLGRAGWAPASPWSAAWWRSPSLLSGPLLSFLQGKEGCVGGIVHSEAC